MTTKLSTRTTAPDSPSNEHERLAHAAADRRGVLEHAEREGGDSRGPRDARAPARHRPQPRRAHGRRRPAAPRRGGARPEPPSHHIQYTVGEGVIGKVVETGKAVDRAAREQGADARLPRVAARRGARRRVELHLRADRRSIAASVGALGVNLKFKADRNYDRSKAFFSVVGVDDRPGAQGAAPRRRPAQAAGQRERAPEAGAARALRLCRHRRQQRPDAARLRAGRPGGADEHDGAAARRIGHRQGAHRAARFTTTPRGRRSRSSR